MKNEILLHKIFVICSIDKDRFQVINNELVSIFKQDNNFVENKDFFWPAKDEKSAGGPLYCRYLHARQELIKNKVITSRSDITAVGNLYTNYYLKDLCGKKIF